MSEDIKMKKLIILLMASILVLGSTSFSFAADQDVPKIYSGTYTQS